MALIDCLKTLTLLVLAKEQHQLYINTPVFEFRDGIKINVLNTESRTYYDII